jgi:PAS domain S-box-containing protein
MNELKFPSVVPTERTPRAIGALLGIGAACLATVITLAIPPLRAFPLLLAFTAVVLSSWFFGMWSGVFCGLMEAILIDSFLTQRQVRFSIGNAPEALRLTVFLTVSLLLGWTIRRSARQRALLAVREIQQRLTLANAERQLAEERAIAGEALRDRDEKLSLAMKANSMGIWAWDVQQNETHWSDEIYRLAGREPGSVVADGNTWFELIHPEDQPGVMEAFEMTRTRGVDYSRQYRVLQPDRSVRWVESQGKSQVDSRGEVIRIIGVISDVTHRKQSEEAMLRAEKLAIVGRLAASVAHEINNPLEAVANLLFLVTLSDTTETAKEYAGQALDELMRVSMITQQTLKFHRQTGAPKPAMLSELVDAVLTLFRGKLKAARIVSDVRVRDEVSVDCLTGETQQVFANLVSNAIEATPEGGKLVVRLRQSRDWRAGAGRGMRVTFFDAGVGMSRATMRRIFEPFFTTKAETGTGLGMWVAMQLVERHNGHMNLWSSQRPGASGTAISVFFPLVEMTTASEVSEVETLPADA